MTNPKELQKKHNQLNIFILTFIPPNKSVFFLFLIYEAFIQYR